MGGFLDDGDPTSVFGINYQAGVGKKERRNEEGEGRQGGEKEDDVDPTPDRRLFLVGREASLWNVLNTFRDCLGLFGGFLEYPRLL